MFTLRLEKNEIIMIYAKEWIADMPPREELLGGGWGGDWIFESMVHSNGLIQWPYPMDVI